LAAAATVTVPLPVPDAPDVTVSHDGSLLVAVHEHQLLAVTPMVPESPPTAIAWLAGEIATEQAAPDCDTAKLWPATVTVACRAAPLLADAAIDTVPLPVPDAPAVTVSQLVSLLAAVQVQLLAVVTVIAPESPPAAIDCDAGEIP
jgi:hypothetical protein